MLNTSWQSSPVYCGKHLPRRWSADFTHHSQSFDFESQIFDFNVNILNLMFTFFTLHKIKTSKSNLKILTLTSTWKFKKMSPSCKCFFLLFWSRPLCLLHLSTPVVFFLGFVFLAIPEVHARKAIEPNTGNQSACCCWQPVGRPCFHIFPWQSRTTKLSGAEGRDQTLPAATKTTDVHRQEEKVNS